MVVFIHFVLGPKNSLRWDVVGAADFFVNLLRHFFDIFIQNTSGVEHCNGPLAYLTNQHPKWQYILSNAPVVHVCVCVWRLRDNIQSQWSSSVHAMRKKCVKRLLKNCWGGEDLENFSQKGVPNMWLIPGWRKGVSECERGRQMAGELKTMTEKERWEGRRGSGETPYWG